MLKPHIVLQAALATAVLAGCGSSAPRTETVPGPEGFGVVRVENQNIRDMRIYVRPNGGGARFRLGTANALDTTTLKIPKTMVAGITELIFEVSPLGGGSQFSEKITVVPGEEIVLRIGP